MSLCISLSTLMKACLRSLSLLSCLATRPTALVTSALLQIDRQARRHLIDRVGVSSVDRYHLKLKQELEELRHEATVLLRERFHLQQCIR